MLGNYEKRRFTNGEKVWIGRYKNLNNVLHWHFECELIRLINGKANIRIGEHYFNANEGDCFFCVGEELHYILSEPQTQIDIMIFDKSIAKDITAEYTLTSPKIPDSEITEEGFGDIKKELSKKRQFYREALESRGRSLIIDIFRSCTAVRRDDKSQFYKNLISKINDEFPFITFADAVSYSGYSPSHFSKMFKKLSGMNFSEFLNIIRVENAIAMLRSDKNITITDISTKCGFSTVRNFNRVFKEITGYSPRSFPKDFTIDTDIRISKNSDFDPTNENSILIT